MYASAVTLEQSVYDDMLCFRLCQTILFLIFSRSSIFVSILGFAALGLESTLPIPQLIRCVFCCFVEVSLRKVHSNYRQRSLYGFRMSTLIGWAGGDAFKHAHFLRSYTCSTDLDAELSTSSSYVPPSNSKYALSSSYQLTSVSMLRALRQICIGS